MLKWLFEPWQTEWMRTALLAAVLIGVNCAVVGTYVVLRRIAFLSHSIAHTILPGVGAALLLQIHPLWGAVGAALFTAVTVGFLSRRHMVREDSATGIVVSAMFALGLVLMHFAPSRSLEDALKGHLFAVAPAELWFLAGLTVPVFLVLSLLHKELELSSYDPVYAGQIGTRPENLTRLLLLLTAFTSVGAMQAVGVVLTSALLVTPAATAALLGGNLLRVMATASALSVAAAVIGLHLSWLSDAPPGACIVLVCTAEFGLVWAWKRLIRRAASAAA